MGENIPSNHYHESIECLKIEEISDEGLSIFQLNVQGISDNNIFQKLKKWLSQLNLKIDIIILGETKLKERKPKESYRIEGYKQMLICRDNTSKEKDNGGGGLLIFIKEHLEITNEIFFSKSFEKIVFNFNINNKKLKLISYYRPPVYNNMNKFLKDLEKEINSRYDGVIIVGDINIDVKKYEIREYFNCLRSYNIEIINDQITRPASGTIIDHVATDLSDTCNKINIHTIKYEFSDHNAVLSIFESWNTTMNKTNFKDNFNSERNFFETSDPNTIAIKLIEENYIAECNNNNYLIDNVENHMSKIPGNSLEHTTQSMIFELIEKIDSIILNLRNSDEKIDEITLHKEISPILLNLIEQIYNSAINPDILKFTPEPLKIIEPSNFLYSHQFACRQNCGTEIAALELTTYTRHEIDKKNKVSAVFMHISKEFDVVNIYPSKCKQQTKIKNDTSKLKSLLFVIFINSISNLELNGKLFIYADKIVLTNSHEANEDINVKLIADMNKIITYLDNQNMILDLEHTNFIIFHSTRMKISLTNEICITDKITINRVEHTKYLGLCIDQHLKWDIHGKYLELILSKCVGILWKIKNKESKDNKKAIYKKKIESHISYMNIIWGTANKNVIEPIQKLQDKALRHVFNIDQPTEYVKMYLNLVDNYLPVRAINFYNTAVFVYSKIRNKIHSNISFKIVNGTNGSRKTRHERKLYYDKANTKYGLRSINIFGCKIYNSIISETILSEKINDFKLNLLCQISNEQFISCCFTNDYLECNFFRSH